MLNSLAYSSIKHSPQTFFILYFKCKEQDLNYFVLYSLYNKYTFIGTNKHLLKQK